MYKKIHFSRYLVLAIIPLKRIFFGGMKRKSVKYFLLVIVGSSNIVKFS